MCVSVCLCICCIRGKPREKDRLPTAQRGEKGAGGKEGGWWFRWRCAQLPISQALKSDQGEKERGELWHSNPVRADADIQLR